MPKAIKPLVFGVGIELVIGQQLAKALLILLGVALCYSGECTEHYCELLTWKLFCDL